MNERQSQLFKNIVEEYIQTAQPVGSKLVVEKFNLNVSPATVRNDMAELERYNLIISPHTSAGRIPTEHGYIKYVEEYIELDKELSKEEGEEVKKLRNIEVEDIETKIKELAKAMAERTSLGVFVGFARNNVYYTGLSNIFSQPEFQNLNLIQNISTVIDHLDDVMGEIYDSITKTEVKIGSSNPFSNDCSVVITKVKDFLIGIMGPMRMDYQNNLNLLNFIKNIL
ncbi:MAG: hypothetical protein ABIA91_03035 [Patescibacteria group bacterium]